MTYKEFKERYSFNPKDSAHNLGIGGFAKVFKAYDTVQDRYVAIKRSEVKPEFKQFTLQREVEVANAIPAHDNVAQYETCYRFESMDAEVDFAVLRYYEEGNINQLLQNKTLTHLEKRQLIRGILRGIQHLHQQKFIHRDIKGGNILVSREQGVWQPKIADFGLSKEVKSKTDTRSVFNSSIGVSYHYAAPEQITGDSKILPNVDLWRGIDLPNTIQWQTSF